VTPLDAQLAWELAELAAAGLARRLPALGGRADFVTSDVLGLARDAAVVEAARSAAAEHGTGARASRLLGGGSPLDRRVERLAAEWLGAEDALLFPSGYQANLGLLGTLLDRGDLLLSERRNHASLIDGARLSRAQIAVFEKGDLDHLAALLAQGRGARRRLIVVEGIYSMDGDSPPLAELAELALTHDARLIVDEAHAAGVVGPQGRGAWAAANPPAEALAARVVTGGKALGVAGALVVGSGALRQLLVHRARSFIFTTGTAPPVAGALAAAIERASAMEGERERARGLAARVAADLDLPPPSAAIVPIPVGEDRRALEVADALRERGLELLAVRPPTVPPGGARLRVVTHAYNTDDEVELLVRALAEEGLPRRTEPTTARRTLPLMVVGTDTGVGKTVVSAALVRAAARRGAVRYWKPVQTGDDDDTTTVRALTRESGAELAEPLYAFPLPASPHQAAAEAGEQVDPARLDAALEELRREPGRLIVELAGGLHVPLNGEVMQSDWLARARPAVVLVARSGLGTLNHSLLTLEALAARGITPRALVLVGEPHAANRETLVARTGLPVLELPILEELDPAALDRWLDAQDLERILLP